VQPAHGGERLWLRCCTYRAASTHSEWAGRYEYSMARTAPMMVWRRSAWPFC
jgi:hypothetical protein